MWHDKFSSHEIYLLGEEFKEARGNPRKTEPFAWQLSVAKLVIDSK